MNTFHAIGNLGADPELRTTPSGKSIVKMSIAVDDYFRQRNSSGEYERKKRTDWIPVIVWDNLADLCATYLQKGSKVAIQGSLRQRTYTNSENKTVHVLEIHATDVDFLANIKSREESTVVENPTTAM